MDLFAKMIGNILMDMLPDAENAFEAIDRYSSILYKRLMLKENAGIDNSCELDLYLFINGYKSKIAEMVYKQTLKGAAK